MAKRKNILEPSPKNSINETQYEVEIYNSFMTYQGISSKKDNKKWILDYISFINKDISRYSHANTGEYSPHGIWARFLCRNIKIPQKEKEALDQFLSSLELKYDQAKKNRESATKDRNKKYIEIVHGYLANINTFIDSASTLILQKKKKEINVSKFCDKMNVPKPIFSEIIDYMNKQVSELRLAKNKTDEQLVEGYSYFTSTQLESYIQVYVELMQYYSDKIQSLKNNRKPRKKKQKTPEQISVRVQYQDKDPICGIVSINPSLVVNSDMVYVFNTKTKAIIYYKAKVGQTLSFKGTSLLNVDDDASCGKKIRGYEKYIKSNSFTFPTIKHIETFFSSLNTKRFTPNPRFNKNTIIIHTK